jgi:hypothetical protein
VEAARGGRSPLLALVWLAAWAEGGHKPLSGWLAALTVRCSSHAQPFVSNVAHFSSDEMHIQQIMASSADIKTAPPEEGPKTLSPAPPPDRQLGLATRPTRTRSS